MYQANNYSVLYYSAFTEQGLFGKGKVVQLFNKFLDLREVSRFITLCTHIHV
jgi:hypothetical protein